MLSRTISSIPIGDQNRRNGCLATPMHIASSVGQMCFLPLPRCAGKFDRI